ncbi:hypothetical protein RFA60_000178 [Vibrio parahaemolyticus]|nr:hypothetical protein [Vibrio parahaemolyticus]
MDKTQVTYHLYVLHFEDKEGFHDTSGRVFTTLDELLLVNTIEDGIDNYKPLTKGFYTVNDIEIFNKFVGLNPELEHIKETGYLYFNSDFIFFEMDFSIKKNQYVINDVDLFDIFNKEIA